MKTTTRTDFLRLKALFLGAALTLAASGAGAFPFFTANNNDSNDTFGEPPFGLQLNNAFDPVVLLVSFLAVDVVVNDSFGSPAFLPEAATALIANGSVELIYGDIDDNTGVFTANGDQGTGELNLTLTGLQYDPTENSFFINGPSNSLPGTADGSIELTGVTPNAGNPNPDGDFQSTPGFNEATQCSNFDLYSGSGLMPDAECIINIGLVPGNTDEQVIKFLLDEPIVPNFEELGSTIAANPGGRLEFAEGSAFHGAVDNVDNPQCPGFWDNNLGCVADPSRYSVAAPAVPAPATLALVGLGLLLMGRSRRLA